MYTFIVILHSQFRYCDLIDPAGVSSFSVSTLIKNYRLITIFMRSESEARRARIEEIASQISDLSTELQELLLEEETDNNSSNRTRASVSRVSNTQRRTFSEEIVVGDRITITNNYRGHKGRTGTVVQVEADGGYIHFQQDYPRIKSKRLPHNLRKLR